MWVYFVYSMDDNVNTDDSIVDDSSDDDLSLMDEFDINVDDLMMLNMIGLHKRSIVDRIPCRTSMLTGKMYM